MSGSRSNWQRLRAGVVGGFIVPGLMTATGGWAAEPPSLLSPAPVTAINQNAPPQTNAPGSPAAPAPARTLDLAACRALALEKQPAVAAANASFAAAVARQQGLENLCVPTFLVRDLPKRREQAALGLTSAQAGVLSAEIDTVYAVEFAYVSYLYAVEQDRLANDVLKELRKIRDGFKDSDADVPEKKQTRAAAVAKIEALELLTQARQQEATVGIERSLSLLREAIGLEDNCPLSLVEQELSESCPLDEQQAVQLALTRRPEIVQASIGTEVTDLEICAQQSRRFALTLSTFATGSDLHANPLPGASFSPGYRPGAIGLEMPVTMVGKRHDRVEQAKTYNARAFSVLEKTRNLIRLETEQAFLRFKEAKKKRELFERGQARARRSRGLTRPPQPTELTDYLDIARLATDLRFETNRAQYEMRIALIALERATAGGFCVGVTKAAPIMIGNE
jgi:outer membrane protein TolC